MCGSALVSSHMDPCHEHKPGIKGSEFMSESQNGPPAAEKQFAALPCSLLDGNVEKSPSGLRLLAVIQEHKYARHPRPSPGLTYHERV